MSVVSESGEVSAFLAKLNLVVICIVLNGQ